MAAGRTVKRPHTPPNDSQPGQPDSSGNVTDLRNLITGKKPPPKLELFTEKLCDNPTQDVRSLAKEITKRNIKLSNYTPPEHQDWYVPQSKSKPTEDPEGSSSISTITAGARKTLADHSPTGRGRKRSKSVSFYSR
jgi:hypothetical protein